MVRRRLIAIIGMMLLASTAFSQDGNRLWTFDSDIAGEIAKEFGNDLGEWNVLADSTAP